MPQLDILILFDEIFLISIAFFILFLGIAMYFLPRILFKSFVTQKIILANIDTANFYRVIGLSNYEFTKVDINFSNFSIKKSLYFKISG